MANITKRTKKDGTSVYRIKVSLGLDATGKQVTKSMSWKVPKNMTARAAEKEVQRIATRFEDDCNGLSSAGSLKFEEFCKQWFTLYAEKQLRPTTLSRLHKHEPRVYAALGNIRMDKLNTRQIQAFINNLEEDGISKKKTSATPTAQFKATLDSAGMTQKQLAEMAGVGASTLSTICRGGKTHLDTAEKLAAAMGRDVESLFTVNKLDSHLAPKTIRLYHSFISSVCSWAVQTGVLKSNPASNVILPPLVQAEKQIYTMEEAQAFLDSLQAAPVKYQAFCVLAIYGGLRRSELLGLEWGDLDFENCTISIRRTSQYTKEKGTFTDTTKTRKSQRTLRLPNEVFSILRRLRADLAQQRLLLGDRWYDSDRLFVGLEGKPLCPTAPYTWLERFCGETGQRFYGIHTFRHLNASLLIESGADVRTVSSMLGHSAPTTTLNIYSHSFEAAQARASAAVADALSGKLKKNTGKQDVG